MTQHQARNQKNKHNFLQKDSSKRKMALLLSIIFAITPVDGVLY